MKYLRVNMKSQTISADELPADWERFGNRGLVAKVALAEIPPACDPLGPENKLLLAQSLLAGTNICTAGRMSVGGKSPLTGGVKEANVGGMAGKYITALGIKLIIVEEQPSEGSYVLLLSADGSVSLVRHDELQGCGTYDTAAKLRQQYGENCQMLVIGPAGERLYRTACIMSTDFSSKEPSRAAARGGLGAVMGSKGLKAVIVQKAAAPYKAVPKDEQAYKTVLAQFHKLLSKHSAVQSRALYGTFGGVRKNAETGVLPVKNFRALTFNVDKIDAQGINDYLERNGGRYGLPCQSGCMIKCSNYCVNSKGEHTASSFNYEVLGMVGSNLLLDNLDIITEIKRLCDDFGIDGIEMGNALGQFAEAGLLPWGDGEAVLALAKAIVYEGKYGKHLAQGSVGLGKALGVSRIPSIRGQSLAAYDLRSAKSMGFGSLAGTMGGDHTVGGGGPDAEGKYAAPTLATMPVVTALDNMFCLFMWQPIAMDKEIMTLFFQVLTALFDESWDYPKLTALGQETLGMEYLFNDLAGLLPEEVPPMFAEEPSGITNGCYDVPPQELAQVREAVKAWYPQ